MTAPVISSMAHVDMVMGRGIMDTASDATMDSMNRSATGGPSNVVDKACKTVNSTATSRPSNVAAIHTAKVDMAYAKTAHGTAAATSKPSNVAAINTATTMVDRAYATTAHDTASNKTSGAASRSVNNDTSGAANSSATNVANVACATTAHNSTGLVDPLCGSGRLCGSVRSDSGGLQLNMHPDGTSTKEFLSKTGTIINAINTCTVVKTGATTGTIVAIDKTSSRWTSSPAPSSPWTRPAAG